PRGDRTRSDTEPIPCRIGQHMKGDRVEIVVDAGGSTLTYEVEATRAGRRVDITHGRGIVEVTEVTRGGTAVRTARFMAARVRGPDDEVWFPPRAGVTRVPRCGGRLEWGSQSRSPAPPERSACPRWRRWNANRMCS